MRKILILILVIVLVVAITLSGYIFFHNSKKNDQPIKEAKQEDEQEKKQEEIIDYGYLKIGEWGIASKYSSKKEEYENVNVTVKQIIRGEEAERVVKEYTQNNKYFTYQEAQEGMDCLVVEYEINFGNYTKGNNGANSDIQTRIKGYGENENIVIGNETYETKTQDISNREYTNSEQISGKFVTQIPKECEKYVIVFGNEEYNYCQFEVITETPETLQQTDENIQNGTNENM